MTTGTIDGLMRMASWLDSHGEKDLARETRETVNRFLDYLLFISQPNSEARRSAEIARSETRSGVQRGALKPNGEVKLLHGRATARAPERDNAGRRWPSRPIADGKRENNIKMRLDYSETSECTHQEYPSWRHACHASENSVKPI